MKYAYMKKDDYLMHYGVKGMKWRHRKNRPLSREERVTEGNGKVGKNDMLPWSDTYANLMDHYDPTHPGEAMYKPRTPHTGNVSFKEAARKDAEKKAKLALLKRPKSRKVLYSIDGNGAVRKRKRVQIGDSVGVRKRRKIYGYKMRQAVK